MIITIKLVKLVRCCIFPFVFNKECSGLLLVHDRYSYRLQLVFFVRGGVEE